jgi:hypothetical protein
MQVTIQLRDTRFDDTDFTAAEARDLIAEMLHSGTYTPDEYTSGLSIQVLPTDAINHNLTTDPANAV